MMKRFAAILFAALATTSCEHIIDIDFHDADRVVVIEANIEAGSECLVKIVRTVAVSDPGVYPPVENAIVTLSLDGLTETLVQSEPGLYGSTIITGVAGIVYTLSVAIDGRTYEAQSFLPPAIALDSVVVIPTYSFEPDEIAFDLYPCFQDPGGEANFYKFELSTGDKDEERVRILSDRFSEGLYFSYPDHPDYQASAPQRLTVESLPTVVQFDMLMIDEPVFTFYNTIGYASGITTPANPISNFSGGCLGYFKAFSRQTTFRTLE